MFCFFKKHSTKCMYKMHMKILFRVSSFFPYSLTLEFSVARTVCDRLFQIKRNAKISTAEHQAPVSIGKGLNF